MQVTKPTRADSEVLLMVQVLLLILFIIFFFPLEAIPIVMYVYFSLSLSLSSSSMKDMHGYHSVHEARNRDSNGIWNFHMLFGVHNVLSHPSNRTIFPFLEGY